MKKEFTNDEIDKIVKLYTSDGLNTTDVAILLGVSKTPILRVLKNKNLLRLGKSNGIKIILSPEQESLIKKMYLQIIEMKLYGVTRDREKMIKGLLKNMTIFCSTLNLTQQNLRF